MNELGPRWTAHPEWADAFTEVDRFLVESLVRTAGRAREGVLPLTSKDDIGVSALLLLAKSLRLDHAALALTPPHLEQLLRDQLLDASRDAFPSAAELSAVWVDRSSLLDALVQRQPLDATIEPVGPPLVVSLSGDAPRFCHIRRLALAEWRVATTLLAMHDTPDPSVLDLLADKASRDTSDSPAAAVAQSLASRRITVVTGGPGTGKTTAVGRVLADLGALAQAHDQRVRVAVAAPTAKAAVRLRDAINQQIGPVSDALEVSARSGSVHRLLGLRPDSDVPAVDILDDLLIVDEVSMMELGILDALLAACSPSTRILLVGDPDQLASVNVGAVLRDIVDACDDGPLAGLVIRLTRNFRSDSTVVRAASAINAGDAAALLAVAGEEGALTIDNTRDAGLHELAAHAAALHDAATSEQPLNALDILTHMVVLCATRRGVGSVAWWRAQGTLSESPTAPGTPLLVTRNEPSTLSGPLANGDVGVVIREGDTTLAVFGPREAPRQRASSQLVDVESAWAITIHKSQGSEYDHVIVSLPDYDMPLLTRELLYTAVTRARRTVRLVGPPAVIDAALSRRISRVSALRERCAALTA